METNPQVHIKVIEAFESGEYGQTRKRLAVSDSRAKGGRRYCAVGLVCEIYRQETGNGRWLTLKEIRELGLEPFVHGLAYDLSETYFVVPRPPFSWERRTNERNEPITYYRASASAAPDVVLDWAGLLDDRFDMSIDVDTQNLSRSVKALVKKVRETHWTNRPGLIALNDEFRAKFSTLAKVLREVPLFHPRAS